MRGASSGADPVQYTVGDGNPDRGPMFGSIQLVGVPTATDLADGDAAVARYDDVSALPGAPQVTCPAGAADFPLPPTNTQGPSKQIDHVIFVVGAPGRGLGVRLDGGQRHHVRRVHRGARGGSSSTCCSSTTTRPACRRTCRRPRRWSPSTTRRPASCSTPSRTARSGNRRSSSSPLAERHLQESWGDLDDVDEHPASTPRCAATCAASRRRPSPPPCRRRSPKASGTMATRTDRQGA